MPNPKVPQPGSAKLTKNSGPDEWLKCALNNQYLPEAIMKKLCEICKELLMEGKSRNFLSSIAAESEVQNPFMNQTYGTLAD